MKKNNIPLKTIVFKGRLGPRIFKIPDSTDLQTNYDWTTDGPHHLVPYKKTWKPLNEEDLRSKNMFGDHIKKLFPYFEGCKHITEVGHSIGHTARAFAFAKPKRFVAYDLLDCTNNNISEICKENNIDYSFHRKDILSVKDEDFEETEFLWLDGNHSAEHVYKELVKLESKVSKYIFSDDIEPEGTPGPTGYGVEEGFTKFLKDNDTWELHTISRLAGGFIGIRRKSS